MPTALKCSCNARPVASRLGVTWSPVAKGGGAAARMEFVAAGNNDPFNSHPVDSADDAPNRRVEVRVTNRAATDPVRTEPAVE